MVDLPDGLPEVGEAWFYKAWMFRLCNQKKLIGIDLDCEVRGSLQPIFDLIGDRIVLAPDCPMGEYAKVFVPGIFFNSGVVGVSRDNPLLATWEEETLRKHPHFRSDQEILNFVLYQGGVEVVAL
ncbi:MAG: hypothetical protein GWO24_22265, partial [Akkermansiaceae bacterium]|nr:hypothetical protein [Akkermansiaceae bacterium]